MQLAELVTSLLVLLITAASSADGTSITIVEDGPLTTGYFPQRTIAQPSRTIEVYDAQGQHHATWRSASEPLFWLSGSEGILFLSPKDDGFVYVVGNPATQRVNRVSAAVKSAVRQRVLLGRGRLLLSCGLNLSDCLAVRFPRSLLPASHARVDADRDPYDPYDKDGEFAAGIDWVPQRGWFGWATFEARLLSARACQRATLWQSPDRKWMAVVYGGQWSQDCVSVLLIDPLAREIAHEGVVSRERAQRLLSGASDEASLVSPDGQWYATPLENADTVIEWNPRSDRGVARVSPDAVNPVWWHRDSMYYVFGDSRGLSLAWVDGRRQQLVLGVGWQFAGWIGEEIIVVAPLSQQETQAYRP